MIADGEILTQRLAIRPFATEDADRLVALLADPQVARFVGDGQPLSPADAAAWVVKSRDNIRRFGYGTGAVIRKADGELIGWAGFARPEGDLEQLVYGLSTTSWRQDFGSEIVDALTAFADERGFETTYATVDPANRHSIRLLERSGFELAERSYHGNADTALYRRAVNR